MKSSKNVLFIVDRFSGTDFKRIIKQKKASAVVGVAAIGVFTNEPKCLTAIQSSCVTKPELTGAFPYIPGLGKFLLILV